MRLLWMLACSGDQAPAAPPPARGDRILVIVDTLRADALERMPTTRALDARRYERAYSASSWTLSSVATLLTGLGPWQHRVVRDPLVDDEMVFGRLDDQVPTLAEAWSAQGYRRAAFVNNTFLAPEFALGRGFELYDWQGAGPVEHRSAEQTVADALGWLDAAEGPAFLVLHVMEPHSDYVPPPSTRGTLTAGSPSELQSPLGEHIVNWMRGDEPPPERPDRELVRNLYLEEVAAVDLAMAQLVEGLKARDRWDEAVFVLTADHGEEFWEHGGFEHGHSLLSEVTRVPLVVKAPELEDGVDTQIVDAREVAAMLLPGEAGLRARQGDGIERALSEGILYGDEYFSVVTPTHRVEACLEPDCRVARVWALEGPVEGAAPMDPSAQVDAVLKGAVTWASEQRGGLQATRPALPVSGLDAEGARQLEALGYLER